MPPNYLIDLMKNFGLEAFPYLEEGKLKIIDCYSGLCGEPTMTHPSVIFIKNPFNLTDMRIGIDRAKTGMRLGRLVFDSISSIMLDCRPESVIKFLQTQTARIKRDGGIGLYILELGVHDLRVVNTLLF